MLFLPLLAMDPWSSGELPTPREYPIPDQLKDVREIHSSPSVFAAILGDGSVVTWGDAVCGGDNSRVRDQLRGVRQLKGSAWAFAAILGDLVVE